MAQAMHMAQRLQKYQYAGEPDKVVTYIIRTCVETF